MTSTGAKRLFPLRRAHIACAGVSRDDTRANVSLGHADGTVAWMRGARTARRSESCCARGRGSLDSR
eukprot:6198490-Pleurochrysis_carterae.AAC.1